MSIKKIVCCLLAFAPVAVGTARAQVLQPFIDPHTFGHDMQFFAPAELGEFGGAPEPRVGWYGSYNRMYLWTSRPEHEASFTKGDYTWGNRVDMGYMTEDDHGWHMSFSHLDGPNHFITLRVDRINRINDDDQPPDDPELLISDENQIVAIGPNGPFPRRYYDVKDSLNDADYSAFELNKTFRQRQLHHGGVLEPFIGFRYMKYTDRNRFDIYQHFDPTGELLYTTTGGPAVAPPPVLPGMPPLLVLPDTGATIEQFTSNKSVFENNMFGGQLGARLNMWKGNWNLSAEFRAFAVQNFQNLRNYVDNTVTLYDGGVRNSQVDQILLNHDRVDFHFDEFVFGAEVRAEAAYAITRDVALTFGLEFIELGQGIGRGSNPFANAENVTMVGAVFGVYVCR